MAQGARRRFSRLPDSGDEDQSSKPEKPYPWPSIRLALGLFVAGITLAVFGTLHINKHVVGKDGAGFGLLLLGSLAFIPGFHQSRVAYYAWQGRHGYKFEDIIEVR